MFVLKSIMKRNAQGKFSYERRYFLSVGQEECHSPCRRDGFRRLLIEASCMIIYLSMSCTVWIKHWRICRFVIERTARNFHHP